MELKYQRLAEIAPTPIKTVHRIEGMELTALLLQKVDRLALEPESLLLDFSALNSGPAIGNGGPGSIDDSISPIER